MELNLTLIGTMEEMKTLFHDAKATSVRSYDFTEGDPDYATILMRMPEDFKYAGLTTIEEWTEADKAYGKEERNSLRVESKKATVLMCSTGYITKKG